MLARGVALAFAVALAAAGSAAAATTVAEVARPTPLSASKGRVVWSVYDPATGMYALTVRAGGVTSTLPVRPRSVPFDADLGRDAHGATVAVYSRCAHEPAASQTTALTLPRWETGRGCSLWSYDFATGAERPIHTAERGGASDFLPTIWGSRIAFARVYPRRRGARGRDLWLYVRALSGGRSVRVPGGPRGREDARGAPTGLDLRGRTLAFGWHWVARPFVGGVLTGARPFEVRVDTIGGGHRLIEREADADEITGSLLTAPSISGGHVYYALTMQGDTSGSRFRRYDLATGRHLQSPPSRSPPFPDVLVATAADGRALYEVTRQNQYDVETACPGVDPDRPAQCTIARVDPLTFSPGLTPGP